MRANQKFTLLGLLCLLLTANTVSYGQQSAATDSVLNLSTTRYLTLGLGSMSLQLNDEHMSPLNYHGGSVYLQLGAFKRKKQTIRNFNIGATYMNMGPMEDNREIDPQGQYIRFDLSYSQQYHIRSLLGGTVRWYAGGMLKSHSNIRLNEQLDGAFVTFLFANGLFASSTLEREVYISRRPVTVSWQLDLPIINHTIRPDYLNIYDFVNPENDWVDERVDDSEWRAIDSYSNITSTVSLLYPIKTGNVLRFSYAWDFYHIASRLRATNATHTFIFSLYFKY